MRRQGTIDGLILGSVDRLSRDPFDGGAVCRDALRAGLRLFFAEDRLDVFLEEDQVNIISLLVASRKYAQRLKAQTMPARKAELALGRYRMGKSVGHLITIRPAVRLRRTQSGLVGSRNGIKS